MKRRSYDAGMLAALLLAGALLAPAPAFAQAGPAAAPSTALSAAGVAAPAAGVLAPRAAAYSGPVGAVPAGNLLQTIAALCAVLGLLAALAWFLKRYSPKAAGGSARLRVVGALNLGGRERIMVVEVGEQWIVVGAAPGRVNALATMPRQAGLPEPVAAPAAGSASFAHWLKQTIERRDVQ